LKIPDPPLLVITDRSMVRSRLEDTLAAVLEGGCRWIMVREKDLSTADRLALVERIVALARSFGATVTVNGDLEAAAIADGAHLPQGQAVAEARARLGTESLVGVSAHDLEEARAAARDGADYITLSPIFPTNSKLGYGPALTPKGLADVVAEVDLPVIALGGVTTVTAAACRRAGAAGLAVMGTIMRAGDPAETVCEILDQWNGASP
jgi:thiamine-phosphate pyrophosphorylase